MKVISNDKLIKRNRKLGNVCSILAIIVLGVGMFLSFKDKDGSLLPYTFSALIVGLLLFQLGNYYMGKWGRSPRPDERLSSALKGLDDKYTLYHYITPVSHLLIGPSGVICLIPFHQAGTITYDEKKGRWKQSGGNFFMKTFGGEGLGRPDNEIKFNLEDISRFIAKKEIHIAPYEPEPVLVFTNENTTLSIENSPVAAISSSKLKDFLRKKAKDKPLPLEMIKDIETKINS